MNRMTGPLISADELRAVLADVTVLDVRYRMGGPGGPARKDENPGMSESLADWRKRLDAEEKKSGDRS